MSSVENRWLIKTADLPRIISRNFLKISLSAIASSELAGSMGIMISASRKKARKVLQKRARYQLKKNISLKILLPFDAEYHLRLNIGYRYGIY